MRRGQNIQSRLRYRVQGNKEGMHDDESGNEDFVPVCITYYSLRGFHIFHCSEKIQHEKAEEDREREKRGL